jgi:hypothetical protein
MSLTIEVNFYDVPTPVNYTIPWSANLTIQAAMEACFNQYSVPHAQHPFTFWIQYYGTYNSQYVGYMPITINGRQRSDQYIWFVYLNKAKTNNSLDAVTLNPGDLVEFRYESYDASKEAVNSIYKTITLMHQSKTKLQTLKILKPNSMRNSLVMPKKLLFPGELETPAANSFVRDTLADDGSLPNTGNLNASPDIIPQQSPADPQQVQQLFGQSTFGSDPGQQIEYGQSNYIYLRAKNPTTAAAVVTISVFWANPSTLQYPSTWQQNKIGNSQTITVPAYSVLAAPEPCIWTPLQLPTPGHYCLITELTWAGQPPVPSSFPSLNDWWNYCRNQNTIAQRNIDIINDLPDNVVDRWLDLINPTTDPGVMHMVQAVCNVPKGSTVSLYCPSASLNPSINTGAIVIVATNNSQVVSTNSTAFPANFQGTLEMKFTPPAGAPAGEYSIVVQQFITDGATYKLLGSYNFDIQL